MQPPIPEFKVSPELKETSSNQDVDVFFSSSGNTNAVPTMLIYRNQVQMNTKHVLGEVRKADRLSFYLGENVVYLTIFILSYIV
jgi:hypothetical protein